jgi:hypothetical protein
VVFWVMGKKLGGDGSDWCCHALLCKVQ